MTRTSPTSDHEARAPTRSIDLRSVPARASMIAYAILLYPALLALFYKSGRIATRAPSTPLRIVGWAGVVIFIGLALALPISGFVLARSHGERPLSPRDLSIRRMAHLTAMAPPLYTATGVWLLILGRPGWTAWGLDAVVWMLAWPVAFILLVRRAARRPRAAPVVPHVPPAGLRISHGIVAALLILAFIGAHLLNHVVGLFGYAADKAVMDVLRVWYRSEWVQPFVIAGFLFMMGTGAALARYRTVTSTDTFGTLQTMTGAYIAAFLFSHMSAVLILARGEHGIDTDWHYAIGAPLGFFGGPGNVRLIPHYFWAVIALVAHAACGLRGVMLAHGARRPIVDRTAWIICAGGAVLSAIILSALLGAGLQ